MRFLALFALLVHASFANTEKSIFIAPPAIELPAAAPTLEHLRLQTLSSATPILRTALPVAFPTQGNPKGRESWYLLQNLNEGQRYEVRVCWAAIQPTDFWLDVYNITHVFDAPHLIQSLSAFVDEQLLYSEANIDIPSSSTTNDISGSVLFLHIHATADFFTTNKTLMQSPPRVSVDIILDPYLANIFPTSLLPTVVYIVILAVGAWLVSGRIWNLLQPRFSRKQRTD